MRNIHRNLLPYFLLIFAVLCYTYSSGQTITGVWKGKIKNTKVELKLARYGDSLTGTAYYYKSKSDFRRYTIKGYFDPLTNQVIWWDDILVGDKATGLFTRSHTSYPLLSTADFNCPGENKMFLDGTASLRDRRETEKGKVQLEKTDVPVFSDEWDFVLENFLVGANDPHIIDSVSNIALLQYPPLEDAPVSTIIESANPVKDIATVTEERTKPPEVKPAVEQKFVQRKKSLATVIPVTADSIELRFYDNAEIDGDSIALFLNNVLLFKNIRLTDQAYSLKLAASSLENDNELVMVAENLGSIPPNTSLMIAIVGDKRYEARLQSTENSSALIRFIKPASHTDR